ncbi:MAG: hypothetical protein FWH15_06315 [Betaproteobacteria bacterium]|nr:hypothetical protein [Betaproteobacteria bacterium]
MLKKLGDCLIDLLWNYFGVFVAVALLALAGTAGWTINGWRWEAKFATLQKDHAEETAAQSLAVISAIEQVRELEKQGNEIAARLIEVEAARKVLAKERDNAIKALTTGEPCLAAPVVRLLNDPVGSGVGLRLPPSSGNSSDPDTAPAADTVNTAYFATDTDVALWARNARDEHDACRARIDALRDFFQGRP